MTEMLWYLDCYLHEWSATITEIIGDENNTEVVLDVTAFYPEGGGQPSDTGIISLNEVKFNVLSSRKSEGNIFHKVTQKEFDNTSGVGDKSKLISNDKNGLKVGDAVFCKVDWQRRYTLMRYHTACHILSRIVLNETGALTTGKQIYIDRARIDFSLKDFDKNKIKGYEELANQAIQQEHDIKWFVARREDADKIPDLVRLKHKPLPEDMREVRIVDIINCDAQACGGTHLKNTREVGRIIVTKAENKGKENRRIEFVLE